MAKAKSKTKKLTRRQMVTLLGSGVVFAGGAGSREVEAQAPNACRAVRPMRGTAGSGPNQHPILMADPCCKEGVNVFFSGYDTIKEPVKGHMKEFADALTSSNNELLEYCVMVWGLKLEERADLMKQVTERYQMKEYPSKSSK